MKVRNKKELLQHILVYEAMKKDESYGMNLRGNTAYWRLAVEWAITVWKVFNFNRTEISKLIAYVNDNNVIGLTEERRENIRLLLKEKNVEWTLRNMAAERTRTRTDNYVDLAVRQLEYHNTEVAVDYSLLAFEYLILRKKFDREKLDRCLSEIYYLDLLPSSNIWEMREELYNSKQIFIQLGKENPEDMDSYTYDEYAAEVFQS